MTNEIPNCLDRDFLIKMRNLEKIVLESGLVKKDPDGGIGYQILVESKEMFLPMKEFSRLLLDYLTSDSGIFYQYYPVDKDNDSETPTYGGCNHTCEVWSEGTNHYVEVRLRGHIPDGLRLETSLSSHRWSLTVS